ncbi:phosphatidylinositol-specific phospholipase C/glycerophosphodiester phosphodiesterase family protein [Chitinophaga rhizophila]|uniref:Altered inheritance of mitochondria protein 6 n=1 Tax=Chitinophaga rhizophila TaxID=2866212 RepID=A0ABS7G638_9BACT|nr:phosphatidylinositol-specific phospholipase C/glycerophosphodiester phosphodiesterase family protein [Chitinophaga rhizophila]MBW8683127.1 phosphatidylinositol-specific phospholipase C/glycerophosphodiester phosphodiesterase family protein [Chitinophaga rhizophila]
MNYLKFFGFTLILIIKLSVFPAAAQLLPLHHGYAHNDYHHKQPLYEALGNGYTYIEADIYLWRNQLIVAHVIPQLRLHKTLERLYLKPLLNCINGTDRTNILPDAPITLMIDIKSASEPTYQALATLLKKYHGILSEYRDGKIIQRQVTIVITGHKPTALLKAQQHRFAFIDEDLMQVQKDTLTTNLYQTASCKYSRLLKWNGRGDLPAEERRILCDYVRQAHRYGKKVRLWASPENPVVWNALLDCGVDLINTDRLTDLKEFLNDRQAIANVSPGT